MVFQYPPGATPIDADEVSGLVPVHITTQSELNAWEQANIVLAHRWASRQKKRTLLNETFVRDLHRHMFDKTWQWAGTFRQSNKNIGVDWPQVSVKLRELIDNTHYQIDNQVFYEDEIAVRFHHQLVWIHVFPNGNGRHARMMTNLLITQLGQPKLTWGSNNTLQASVETIRQRYLAALREADQGDINSLLAFARS